MPANTPKGGILLYDYLFAKGGAEKLSFSIVNAFKNTDFCVGLKDDALFPDAVMENNGGRLYALTRYTDKKGWKTLKTMLTFVLVKVFRKPYQWAIYSGEYAPMAILRNRNKAQKNVLYCHTIPRAPYDLYEFKLAKMSLVSGLAFKVMCLLIKSLYGPAIRKMDVVIANSENVRARIKNYLGLDAIVINPPIDVERFKWLGQGDYYLSTARLEPAKRVDVILKAFMSMPDKKLLVASGGSQSEELRALAKGYDNITFMGWSSDQQLFEAVGHCIATIYIPVDEDFGMSPIESMSAGKPVIGAAEGGLLETVLDGETGVLLKTVTTESLISAVKQVTGEQCLSMRVASETRAQRYSEARFIQELQRVLAHD